MKKQAVLVQTLSSYRHTEKEKKQKNKKTTLKVSMFDRAELCFISRDVKPAILRYVSMMYAANDGKAEKAS